MPRKWKRTVIMLMVGGPQQEVTNTYTKEIEFEFKTDPNWVFARATKAAEKDIEEYQNERSKDN